MRILQETHKFKDQRKYCYIKKMMEIDEMERAVGFPKLYMQEEVQ